MKTGQNAIVCLVSAASVVHRLMKGFNNKRPCASLSSDKTHSWSAPLNFWSDSENAAWQNLKNPKVSECFRQAELGQEKPGCLLVVVAAGP